MKKDVENSEEENIKAKEQAILELGALLAATAQADGLLH